MKSKVKTRHTFKHQKLYITNIKKSIQSPVTGSNSKFKNRFRDEELVHPVVIAGHAGFFEVV